jgi:hypothetical protein
MLNMPSSKAFRTFNVKMKGGQSLSEHNNNMEYQSKTLKSLTFK